MRNSTIYLALAIVFATIIFAILFRYEYLGPGGSFVFRVDRWTGCVERWSSNEETYSAMDKSC